MHDDVGGAKGAVSLKAIVDHLVYATPDLSMGVQRIAEWLGVEPVPGGEHPGRGTRNALVALGRKLPRDRRARSRPATTERAAVVPHRRTAAAAAGDVGHTVGDIHEVAHRAAAAGIHLGSIGDGRRTRADGVALTWRFSDPAVSVYDGIVPFLIDWGASPHPAMMAPTGGECRLACTASKRSCRQALPRCPRPGRCPRAR